MPQHNSQDPISETLANLDKDNHSTVSTEGAQVQAELLPIARAKDFVSTDAETAGKSGSKQVKDNESTLYQFKVSGNNKFFRSLITDRDQADLLAEFMASRLLQGMLKSDEDGPEIAPQVDLAAADNGKGFFVTSRYINNTKDKRGQYEHVDLSKIVQVGTGGQKISHTFLDSSHARYDKADDKEYSINKKDYYRGLSASIILGEHDVNPGNFVIIKPINEEKQPRLARIDMGHAFNDLIKKTISNQAQKESSGGYVLDAINRKEVNHAPFAGQERAKTKFRRYNDMDILLDPEFADSLRSTSIDDSGLAQITDKYKTELKELSKLSPSLNNKIQDSLITLGSRVGMSDNQVERPGFFRRLWCKICNKPYPGSEERIDRITDGIKQSITENQHEARSVANLLDVQRTVDNMIKGTISIEEGTKAITSIYQKDEKYLKGKDPFGTGPDNKIEWVRLNDKEQIIQQPLINYIQVAAKASGRPVEEIETIKQHFQQQNKIKDLERVDTHGMDQVNNILKSSEVKLDKNIQQLLNTSQLANGKTDKDLENEAIHKKIIHKHDDPYNTSVTKSEEIKSLSH